MAKYWNGYQWVTEPKMASLEPKFDLSDRAEMLEQELEEIAVARVTTREEEPIEVEVMIEQPTPNHVIIPLTLYPEKVVYAPLKEVPEDTTPGQEKPKDAVITDEVRARVRAELAATKPSGSSK